MLAKKTGEVPNPSPLFSSPLPSAFVEDLEEPDLLEPECEFAKIISCSEEYV